MNRYSPLLFTILLVLFLPLGGRSGRLCAQEKPPLPPPSAPFVRNAPANSSWTMELQKTDDPSVEDSKKTQRAFLKKTSVQKIGPDRREIDEWSDGKLVERWYHQGYHIFKQYSTTSIFVVKTPRDLSQRMAHPDYSKDDFPRFNWLSPQTYIGEKTFKGRAAYLFEKPETNVSGPIPIAKKNASGQLTPAVAQPPQRTLQVWIDPQSRLPIASFDGRKTWVYSYQDTPSTRPALPSDFQAALKKYVDARTVSENP